MDKKILKQVIKNLKQDDTLSVNLLGEREHLSGEYTVVDKKIGRGKGGSQNLVLLSATSEDTLKIGTPQSDEILNVVVDGELHGYTNKAEVPVTFETNVENSAVLKKQFEIFDDGANIPCLVEIDANTGLTPELNGVFTVTNATQLRGRHGQIVLSLSNDAGTQHVWSFRHSGVIKSFRILSEIDNKPTE